MFSLDDQNNQTDDGGVVTEPTSVPAPVVSEDNAVVAPAPLNDDDASPAASDELKSIRQEALQKLSPIIGQLDQTPEEKFKTTMMIIQTSDDQSLIKVAFEAAKAIENEKTRAEALLDIVNEINYFTQPKE